MKKIVKINIVVAKDVLALNEYYFKKRFKIILYTIFNNGVLQYFI